MTSGCISRDRTAMVKFFTFQSQVIVGFSSLGEVAYNPFPRSVEDRTILFKIEMLYWLTYEDKFLTKIGL